MSPDSHCALPIPIVLTNANEEKRNLLVGRGGQDIAWKIEWFFTWKAERCHHTINILSLLRGSAGLVASIACYKKGEAFILLQC